MGYVFGYTNFIDGSARSLPPPGNTFYQGKARDTFASQFNIDLVQDRDRLSR